MKKSIIFIAAIAAIAIVAYIALSKDGGIGSAKSLGVEGRIVNMDLERAISDGPYVIIVKDDKGVDNVINVPSMGLPLCAARENIVSPSELSVGMKIEVRGALTPEGILVPCELPEHYLRIDQ